MKYVYATCRVSDWYLDTTDNWTLVLEEISQTDIIVYTTEMRAESHKFGFLFRTLPEKICNHNLDYDK